MMTLGTKCRPWKPREEDFLRENYSTLGAVACAERIGRTIKAVEERARLLGVPRRQRLNSRYRAGLKDLVLRYRQAHPDATPAQIGAALDCHTSYIRKVFSREGMSSRQAQPAGARDPEPQPPPPKPSAVYNSGFIRPPSLARLMGGKA